jgi:hypothetical protein
MRIEDFPCEFGLIVVGAKSGAHPPHDECDEKECCGGSQPVPKERL